MTAAMEGTRASRTAVSLLVVVLIGSALVGFVSAMIGLYRFLDV